MLAGGAGGGTTMKRTWGALGLAIVVSLISGLADADEAGGLSRYDIRVTLDPMTQTLVGSQRVEYLNDTDEALDEILFCLIGNWGAEPNPYLHPAMLDPQYVAGFDPTWTRIDRMTDGSDRPLAFDLEPLPPAMQTYSLDDGLVVVELPTPLEPGERATLKVEFETRFARALLPENSVYRDTFVWRFGWHPIAVPSTALGGGFVLPAAAYRVELTVPAEYQAFGGADRQTKLETVAGLTTHELENDRPARSVPLVIGPDLRVVSSTWDGVDLQAVYLPGGETAARLALSNAAEILASHSDRFGPFAYRRLVIVEDPTPGFYGMAADGMILVGRSAVELKDMPALGVYDRLVEYLLAHEVAHLWWGIGIGTDFNAENWISEAFAEYLSIGYFEEKYGAFEPNLFSHLGKGLFEDVLRSQFGYLNLRQHLSEAPYVDLLRLEFDEAIVKPLAEVEYLNGQTVRTYNKGYLVLRALEALVGRETLRTALVEANDAWRGRTLSVGAFQRLVEGISGTDLSGFFHDWLYGDARLDMAVAGFETTETGSGYATNVRLRRDGSDLPVNVHATLADGSVVEKGWTPDCCAADALVFETDSPIVSVHLDPDEMLPDANRFNNHYPRRILITHPFRNEDAPKIGKPLDAYVIRVSPIGVSGGFRNDHAWNVTMMPHVDVDAVPSDITDVFESWDVVGLLAADVNRRLSFSAVATITALDFFDGSGKLDAWFTVHTRAFTNPEIGSAGTYWYPTYQSELTIGARGELARPIPYLALTLRRSDLLRLYMINAVTLQAGIPGFGAPSFATAEWSGAKRFRFAPMFYLDAEASAASSLLEALPTEFLFALDGLHAFTLPPHGYHQIYGRAKLVFPPLARNQGYAILNLTRLEDATVSAFIQGGRTWGGCDRVCESGIRIEAGGMITLRFDGFLGTSIECSVGYAHPLFGLDGEGAPFLELATPF
jgi:hypothetical protein